MHWETILVNAFKAAAVTFVGIVAGHVVAETLPQPIKTTPVKPYIPTTDAKYIKDSLIG